MIIIIIIIITIIIMIMIIIHSYNNSSVGESLLAASRTSIDITYWQTFA